MFKRLLMCALALAALTSLSDAKDRGRRNRKHRDMPARTEQARQDPGMEQNRRSRSEKRDRAKEQTKHDPDFADRRLPRRTELPYPLP